MAGERDWDKELAKIDKQLASLPDEALVPAPAGSGKREAGSGKPAAASARSSTASTPTRPAGEAKTWMMYLRLTLSVALGVGMLFWPYEARCGLGLAAYLGAVGVVITSGVWSAVWTWRHRAARAHSLSLLIVLWGLVLGSMEVLPRVGYAKPDVSHPANWACQ